MAHIQHTQTVGFDVLARVRAAFEQFQEKRELRAKYAQTVRELSSMSTRELDDIGVDRYDIRRIANMHVYGA